MVCSVRTYAQQKYEKESRLGEADVPPLANSFIDSLAVPGKVKWYLEEGFDRKSIEAKFSFRNEKYSVEFDTLGRLEDIEIQQKWSDLAKPLRNTIATQLQEDCKNFKIQKVQIQYSGEQSILLSKIKTGQAIGDYTIRYEIIVKCAKAKEINLFEYLFSNQGQKLTASKIVFKNSSNLEY